MKKSKALLFSGFLMSVALLIPQGLASADNAKGTISNATYVNMRDKGSNAGKIVTTLKKGDVVTILNGSGTWDYVQYGNKKGYIYDKYITTPKAAPASNSSAQTGKVVNASMLNVRQQPNATSKIMAVLSKGNQVTILGKSGSWYRIQTGSKTGYVNGKYLSVSSQSVPSTPSPTSPQLSGKTHRVQSGDTLYSIARQYGTTVNAIKQANNLSSTVIRIGQTLVITGTGSEKPVSSTTPPVAPPVTQNLKGKIVVLDPGHGDGRPGAVANGLVEKTVNYDVALKVKQKLEAKGATVLLTRVGDRDCDPYASLSGDLICRANVANNANAHVFISIHSNSSSPAANGAETFYYDASDKSLASALQNAYVAETGLKNRRVAYGNFAVLRNSRTVSALIELGFLTNTSDANKLKTDSFKNTAAEGIVKGIERYFGK